MTRQFLYACVAYNQEYSNVHEMSYCTVTYSSGQNLVLEPIVHSTL